MVAVEWGRLSCGGPEDAPQSRPRERIKSPQRQMRVKRIDNAKTLSLTAMSRSVIVVDVDLVAR